MFADVSNSLFQPLCSFNYPLNFVARQATEIQFTKKEYQSLRAYITNNTCKIILNKKPGIR